MSRFLRGTAVAWVDAGGGVDSAAEAASAKEVSSTSGVNGIPKLEARGLGVAGNFEFAVPNPLENAIFRKPLYLAIESRDSTLISGSVGGVESTRYLDETVNTGDGGTGKSRVLEAIDKMLSPDLRCGLESTGKTRVFEATDEILSPDLGRKLALAGKTRVFDATVEILSPDLGRKLSLTGTSRVFRAADEILPPDLGRTLELWIVRSMSERAPGLGGVGSGSAKGETSLGVGGRGGRSMSASGSGNPCGTSSFSLLEISMACAVWSGDRVERLRST